MARPTVYLITGAPCTGKSTLAAWLCRRLPRPAAGLRTFCTGRSPAGALFSLQNLADGTVHPCTRAEGDGVLPLYTVWEETAAPLVRAALQAGTGTLLLDEALPPHPACPAWKDALAAALGSGLPLVVTASRAGAQAIAALAPGEVRLLDLDAQSPEDLRAALAAESPAPLHAGVSVRLFREEKCFGAGPMELLELVGRTGSLHRAAGVMGMAYSKAWKMLRELERQWGFPMLERRPGGTGGGGSLLTPPAWDLLRRYRALRWETERAAEQSFGRWFGDFSGGTFLQK